MARPPAPTPSDLDAAAAHQILEHLARHPQAADSALGVARWWLADDGRYTVQRVERVLEALAARHALRRERLADGTVIYAARTPGRNAGLHH
ncbi:MAG: hypothetical protein KGL43_00915 [Burkholderiales bacterium]|nr:hypothetical protein [Burkholderiales bacterium]MDE2452127.1 hypothetical protein [Burkholderiales bacterium]